MPFAVFVNKLCSYYSAATPAKAFNVMPMEAPMITGIWLRYDITDVVRPYISADSWLIKQDLRY